MEDDRTSALLLLATWAILLGEAAALLWFVL